MNCRITLTCAAGPPQPVFPADEPAAPADLLRIRRHPATKTRSVTSPLLRARQTASALSLKATSEAALREADFGIWAGQKIETVMASDPEGFMAWCTDPKATPPDGESFASMSARVTAWLEAQATSGTNLLAITHPGPIRAALLHVLAAPLTSTRQLAVKPLSQLRLTHDGQRWSVRIDPATP